MAKAAPPPPKARPFGDPVALSFYSATRHLADSALQPALRDACAALAPQVPAKVLRIFILAGAEAEREDHIQDLVRLTKTAAFVAVNAGEQIQLIKVFVRFIRTDACRETLLSIFDSPAFATLGSEDRRQIMRYLRGPTAVMPADVFHCDELHRAWAQRQAAMKQRICGQTDDSDGPAGWCEFLHTPSLPFHILRPQNGAELSIYIFGDTASPQSLSYCQFIQFNEDHYDALILSPDPGLKAQWQGPDLVYMQPFEARTTELSPLEELELIRWIESNHPVVSSFEERPSHLPFTLFKGARFMHKGIESVAAMVSGRRGPLEYSRQTIVRGHAEAPSDVYEVQAPAA